MNRDIYYRHVALFKTQATIDRVSGFELIGMIDLQSLSDPQLVDDLAATFDVGRADLNVVSGR